MSDIYTLSYRLTSKSINNMIVLLQKVQTQLPTMNHSESDLLSSKLAPDMFDLKKQIQLISDQAKGMCARLAGINSPVMEDTETTIDQLIKRLKITVEFIQNIPEDAYAHADDRVIVLPWMVQMMPGKGLSAEEFFVNFAVPNFYFYMVTAYGIMRHMGYNIGKFDYIGQMEMVNV